MPPPQQTETPQPNETGQSFVAEVGEKAQRENSMTANVLSVQAVRAAVDTLAATVRELPAQEQTKLAEAVGLALAAHVESVSGRIQESEAAFQARVSKTVSRLGQITRLGEALRGVTSGDEKVSTTLSKLVDGLRNGTKNLDDLSVDVATIEAIRKSGDAKAGSGTLVGGWSAGLRKFLSGGSSAGEE